MAIRMRRGNLADFDPTKQLSGEFGVSIDNSTGNQKVFMAFGNGNVKELMTVEDAEAQIGELVDDAVDAAIGEAIDTATEAAETATTAAQTATTQAGTATTKAGEAASSASSASADATSAAGSAASADDSAEDSEAWAVGQRDGQDVPTTDETYHNNAKYWAEQASQAAGGGVTSFKGRSGAVSPQSGDYTAAMVGLGNVDNTSDLNKPISTATQTALNGKADTSALNDGSVTKIGTGNVGSATQPVYINGGVPTAGKDFAIKTGTPTNINTNVSLYNGSVQKTGNIVYVNLNFKLDSAWSPSSAIEVLCKLPFKASAEGALTRIHANGSNLNALVGASFVMTNGTLYIGTGPWNFAQYSYIRIYGTYLTND